MKTLESIIWISGLLAGSALGDYIVYGRIEPGVVIVGAVIGGLIGWILKLGKDKDDAKKT